MAITRTEFGCILQKKTFEKIFIIFQKATDILSNVSLKGRIKHMANNKNLHFLQIVLE